MHPDENCIGIQNIYAACQDHRATEQPFGIAIRKLRNVYYMHMQPDPSAQTPLYYIVVP